MTAALATVADEKSTFAISAAFTDENGAPVTPTALNWTLTDLVGNVINSRAGVVVTTPASTVTIVLSGADLALDGLGDRLRRLTLKGTYNSSLGSGLPFVNAAQFLLERDPTTKVVTVLNGGV